MAWKHLDTLSGVVFILAAVLHYLGKLFYIEPASYIGDGGVVLFLITGLFSLLYRPVTKAYS